MRRLHVRATLIILTMATPSTATLAYCASTYYGSVVGEKLTRRLREAAFANPKPYPYPEPKPEPEPEAEPEP